MSITITNKTYDREFAQKVREISGEDLQKCMQCGVCSGGCPMGEHSSLTPRRLVLMAHLGLKERLLDANTPWLCATCNVCTLRCPRGLNVPKITEALRLIVLRENKNYVEPSQLGEEKLSKLPQIAMVSSFRKHTS